MYPAATLINLKGTLYGRMNVSENPLAPRIADRNAKSEVTERYVLLVAWGTRGPGIDECQRSP